jgi:hypothetical protein
MEIVATLIGFVCAAIAAAAYAFYKAPEAFEDYEGLEIVRRRHHGGGVIGAGESAPVTTS